MQNREEVTGAVAFKGKDVLSLQWGAQGSTYFFNVFFFNCNKTNLSMGAAAWMYWSLWGWIQGNIRQGNTKLLVNLWGLISSWQVHKKTDVQRDFIFHLVIS